MSTRNSTLPTPKFSVIVPAYNEQKYLGKCIRSLRCQTLRNLEIIIVDDGSTDQTGQIADWFARQDPRICVVHEKNKGLGPARNTGMKAARGKYIGFVDADDWVESSMFKTLYKRAQRTRADIVFTGVKKVCNGTIIKVYELPHPDDVLANKQSIFIYRRHYYGASSDNEDKKQIPGYIWNAGFKRSFIIKNHLLFQNVLSEDEIFLITALQSASKVAFIPEALYFYRRDNQTSITNSFTPNNIQAFIANMKAMYNLLQNESNINRQSCLNRWYRHVIDLSRALVHRIESSSLSFSNKSKYIQEANQNPLLIKAYTNYSWHNLPLKLIPFYWCQCNNIIWAERLIMEIWIMISNIKDSLMFKFNTLLRKTTC